MFRPFYALALLTLLTQAGCLEKQNGEGQFSPPQNSGTIIGGTEVKSNENIADHIVAVHDAFSGQLCTATLLSRNIAITAAHCIGMYPEDMYIFYGNELSATSGHFSIDKIEISAYWEYRQNENVDTGDIALVYFSSALPENYKPVSLYSKELSKGQSLIFAGYGMQESQSNEGVGILRKVNLEVLEPQHGFTEFVVDQSKGQGACHGDSGGPAFVFENNRYFLAGVTARGHEDPDGTCLVKNISTNPFSYKEWISRMTKKLTSSYANPFVTLSRDQ